MLGFLDLRTWQRPERSGAYAVLIVYSLMYLWGWAGFPRDWEGNGFSLTCYVAPWASSCIKYPEKRKERKWQHVVYLSPFPSKVKAKPCYCHIDSKYTAYDKNGKVAAGRVHHFRDYLTTCDSAGLSPGFWEGGEVYSGGSGIGWSYTYSQDWHCE